MTTVWTKTLGSDYAWDPRNDRSVISSTELLAPADLIKIRLMGSSATRTIDGISIGLRSSSSGDFASTPTRVTFNGGSYSVSLPVSANVWSDEIEFNISTSESYLVHIAQISSTNTRVRYAAGVLEYVKYTSDDETMTVSISGYTSQAYTVTVNNIVDLIVSPTQDILMRHGSWFGDGIKKPFYWGK